MLDTEIDISTVHSKTVEPVNIINPYLSILSSVSTSMFLEKVWLHVADYSIHLTLAVADKAKEEVLLVENWDCVVRVN